VALASGLAAIAVCVPIAPSASAATPLTGEVLNGSGTVSNTNEFCGTSTAMSGDFSVAGSTGSGSPYPGTFIESGHVSGSTLVKFPFGRFYFRASFTITSSGPTKTIVTGSIGSFVTGFPSCYWGTLRFASNSVPFSALVNGQTVSGTVNVAGTLTIHGTGMGATISETFN
jgi:hypothetical protein